MRPAAALLCVVLIVNEVTAAEQPQSGVFELSFRSGVTLPLGDAFQGEPLSAAAGVLFPVWFDVGYRIGGLVFVGASVQYAFGAGPYHLVRLGGEVIYHPMRVAALDPWVGLGFGYEWINKASQMQAGNVAEDYSTTLQGFEFLELQLGIDVALAPAIRLGPFVSASLGQYSHVDLNSAEADVYQSYDLDNRTLHLWLTVGLKLSFLF